MPCSTAPEPRGNGAAPAPHTGSQTTSFRDPARSHFRWKCSDSHSSLFSNFHIVPWLPRKLKPLDWAIQLSATSWLSYSIVSYLLIALYRYLLTELFSCELPLEYSTSWLSYSSVSASWLLTEPFNCQLPLDYCTSWLSYSISQLPLVNYSIVSLSYLLTELLKCELPLDYCTPYIPELLNCQLPLDTVPFI